MWNTAVVAEGNGGSSFARSDLDFDGDLDIDDYTIYSGAIYSDLSGLSLAQAYGQGDLDGDGDNDLNDFNAFRADYNAANGAGAFAAMAGVPEPATIALLAMSGMALLACKRRR